MAEGGLLQGNQMDNATSHLSACRLLECPICLEQMRKPKSLPCLHSFCEECLGTYIATDLSGEMAAVTSFPCPVCRNITSPVNHSEGKETWARQFPTNNLVQSLISCKGMTDDPLYCGPCKETKCLDTAAKLWCKANDTLFCESCKIHFHDVVHKECDIVTISETSHDVTRKETLSVACSTHNKKMKYYCEDHKFIGCSKCIITDHRHCKEVTTTKEYCEKQKNDSQLDDMDKSLGKASNCVELVVKSFDNQVEAMQQCQDVGLSSILDIRQRINTHLDQKQEKITNELNSTYKKEKGKVDLSKQKCSRLRAAIQNTKDASRMAILREDNLETLQLFLRGQAEIMAWDDLIDDFGKSITSVSIKHEIDASLRTLDESTTLTLGRITVDRIPRRFPDGVECIKSLSKCRAKKVGIIDMNVVPKKIFSAVGVVLMPDDHIIVSDYEQENLKLFTTDGQYLDQLKIHRDPRDMCLVDNNTVAVAVSHGDVGIHVLKVQASKLSRTSIIKIPGDIACHGVALVNGHFMVSTPKDIYSVTREGKADKVHSLGKSCYHLACDRQSEQALASLSTSASGNVAVTRLSKGLQTDILNVGVVKDGMGVDVDREGNVYICGRASNNVVQIPADGTEVGELLTSDDGVVKPRAISVCGDKFVVTNQSPQHKNEMHVYQLY